MAGVSKPDHFGPIRTNLPVGRIELGAPAAPAKEITLNILERVVCNNCEGESTAQLHNPLWRCKHCGKLCSYRRIR